RRLERRGTFRSRGVPVPVTETRAGDRDSERRARPRHASGAGYSRLHGSGTPSTRTTPLALLRRPSAASPRLLGTLLRLGTNGTSMCRAPASGVSSVAPDPSRVLRNPHRPNPDPADPAGSAGSTVPVGRPVPAHRLVPSDRRVLAS